jgi:hypothetical protein
LDSFHRDFNTYPNPASYTLLDSQVSGWQKEMRTVTYNRLDNKIPDFAKGITIKGCTLPYAVYTYIVNGVEVTSHTGDLQRIYLDVHTPLCNDIRLIQTISDKIVRARFVLTPRRVQTDSNNLPAWIQFENEDMDQVMCFTQGDPIIVSFMQERGYTIIIDDSVNTPNPAKQTWVNISITPFSMDGHYDTQNM